MSVTELEALERAGWEALCGDSGADFYANVMADDGLMVFPGMVLDKPATLAAIAQTAPWARFELGEVREIVDGGTGVIAYHAEAQRGSADPYRARMSSVYTRRDGAWRLVLHQQTPDPDPR